MVLSIMMVMGSCKEVAFSLKKNLINTYILLDILVCSIALYFYELGSILASPKGESKYT